MKLIYFATLSVLAFVMLLPLCNVAQTDINNYLLFDKLYIKGGTIFYGKILDINEERVQFKMTNGKIVDFKQKVVRKIVQELKKDSKANIQSERIPRTYSFKETGWYNSTYINFPQGFDLGSDWVVSMGLHHSFGYQHNRRIGTGLGIGFDGYQLGNARNVLSAYGEFRGYLNAENFTPFYTLGLGYGFAFKNENKGVIDSKGGLFFNPNIGYRFGGSHNANFVLGMGYKIQRATFSDAGWNGSVFKQKYTFKRLNVLFGVVF